MGILKKSVKERKNLNSAIALRFKKGEDSAPKVTAKGKGGIADEILRIAKENSVPIKEDSDLLEMLYPLELEDEIPAELYAVVAEVLAYVYNMNKKASNL